MGDEINVVGIANGKDGFQAKAKDEKGDGPSTKNKKK